MTQSIAAIGAVPPSMDVRAAGPSTATDPTLQAFHDAAASRDFAAQVGSFSAASTPVAHAGFNLSGSNPLQTKINQGLQQMQRAMLDDTSSISSPMEAAERFQRMTALTSELSVNIASFQIQSSMGLGLSSAVLDSTRSLLKSNE